MRITTHGEKGVIIDGAGLEEVHVPIVPGREAGRADRRRRRVPGRFPGRGGLGAGPPAQCPDRLHAGDAGDRDRRHPGVQPGPGRVPEPAGRRLR